jgi:drug/metabolite transporter (DMT)-like permease
LLRTASTNVPILSHIGNGLMFFGLIIAFHNPMKPADLFRLLLLSAIWGASFLFIRIGAPVLGPLPTAFFRVLIGAVTLAACLPMLGLKWDMQGKWRAVIILGIINSGIPFVMYAIAALWLPAGYSAIFNAMTPLMGVLIGSLFFAEKLTRAKAAGVLMGLAGVGVLTRTGPVVFSHEVLLGALACLVATSCYGLAGFLTRRWITARGGLDSRLVAAGSLVGATLFLLPFSAVALWRRTRCRLRGPASGRRCSRSGCSVPRSPTCCTSG